MHLIFRVHELRYLWLNSVFVVTFTVTTFMGGVVTFMGVCDTYGKLLDTYGSFVIFMGVVTFMGRTISTILASVIPYFQVPYSHRYLLLSNP